MFRKSFALRGWVQTIYYGRGIPVPTKSLLNRERVQTKTYFDGTVVLFNRIYMQKCGILLDNRILGPFKDEDEANSIFPFCLIPPVEHVNPNHFLRFSAKFGIDPSCNADRFYEPIQKKTIPWTGFTEEPLKEWKSGRKEEFAKKKVLDLFGIYVFSRPEQDIRFMDAAGRIRIFKAGLISDKGSIEPSNSIAGEGCFWIK